MFGINEKLDEISNKLLGLLEMQDKMISQLIEIKKIQIGESTGIEETATQSIKMKKRTLVAFYRLLCQFEWSAKGRSYDFGDHEQVCPCCWRGETNGHFVSCALDFFMQLLKKEAF